MKTLFNENKIVIRVLLLLLALCFLLSMSIGPALASQEQWVGVMEKESLEVNSSNVFDDLDEMTGVSLFDEYKTGEIMIAPVPAGAVTYNVEDYLAVVDTLYKELGVQVKLPDKGLCETFGFTGLDITIPPDEFERQLREDLAKAAEENAKATTANEDVLSDPTAIIIDLNDQEWKVEITDYGTSEYGSPGIAAIITPAGSTNY